MSAGWIEASVAMVTAASDTPGGGLALRWAVLLLYLVALCIAALYGLHRYWLVLRHARLLPAPSTPTVTFSALPHVTVQLPIYNEASVVERLIDAACRLDYPGDRLAVQVLDDSTDECTVLARGRVEAWRARGVDIHYVHRDDRTGFKAGALEAGLERSSSDFVAVFDADFVPAADFLRRTVHWFTDESVGMVQACWDHLNRNDSLLTRCQAIFLDSHFLIEHAVRHRTGRWFNFNGTAGVWRRQAIESAGGWQHDTLTEDTDLSYRAQLAGWRFVYLQDVRCPAELPPEMNAFRTQQHRWTKGLAQTAIKLLPRILRARVPFATKVEAVFHLTAPVVYPCVVIIAFLMFPTTALDLGPFAPGTPSAALFGLLVLLLATASGTAFYAAGQLRRGAGLWRTLASLPAVVALGVGMSVSNTRAVAEAVMGHQSPFLRTPKYSREGQPPVMPPHQPGPRGLGGVAEVAIAAYLIACAVLAITLGVALWSLPFLMLFASGYLWVGLGRTHADAVAAGMGTAAVTASPASLSGAHGA